MPLMTETNTSRSACEHTIVQGIFYVPVDSYKSTKAPYVSLIVRIGQHNAPWESMIYLIAWKCHDLMYIKSYTTTNMASFPVRISGGDV